MVDLFYSHVNAFQTVDGTNSTGISSWVLTPHPPLNRWTSAHHITGRVRSHEMPGVYTHVSRKDSVNEMESPKHHFNDFPSSNMYGTPTRSRFCSKVETMNVQIDDLPEDLSENVIIINRTRLLWKTGRLRTKKKWPESSRTSFTESNESALLRNHPTNEKSVRYTSRWCGSKHEELKPRSLLLLSRFAAADQFEDANGEHLRIPQQRSECALFFDARFSQTGIIATIIHHRRIFTKYSTIHGRRWEKCMSVWCGLKHLRKASPISAAAVSMLYDVQCFSHIQHVPIDIAFPLKSASHQQVLYYSMVL